MHNQKLHQTQKLNADRQSGMTIARMARAFYREVISRTIIPLRKARRYRAEFNQAVAYKLALFAALMAGFHFFLAACFTFIPYSEAPLSVIQINMGAGVLAALLFFLLRRFTPPPKHANLVLTCMLFFPMLTVFYYISVTQEIRQTVFLLFILIAASQFYISVRWFSFTFMSMLVSWYAIATQLPRNGFYYYGFFLLLGAVTAVVVFIVRRDSHQRFAWLRRRDAQRKAVLKYRAEQLSKSQSISQQIGSVLDISQLADKVVNLIWQEFKSDYVNLFFVEPNGRFLELRAFAGEEQTNRRLALELPIDDTNLPGWVVQNGRYRYTPNVNREPLYFPIIPDLPVYSQLDLPLQDGRRMFGVLSLQSRTHNAFDPEDILYLQLLASQVTNGIRNALSYQGERSARHLAETLQETGRALASTLDWSTVMDLILERLAEIVQYDRAAVLVQKDEMLEFVSFRGFPPESEPQDIMVPLKNDTVFGKIAATKQPVALDDASQQTDWQSVESLPQARSWLGVPLIRSGSVIGMLSLARTSLNPYLESEIELAAAFAGQAAIALENARRYEETTRFNQQLEYEVRQRTRVIQDAYEELEELNRNKSDFISVVSHELRTPLTILHGYTQMLMQDAEVMQEPMRQMLVQGIETGSQRLAEIINSMLDVVKIENQELNLVPSQISLNSTVKFVVDDVRSQLNGRSLILETEPMELPLVDADPDMLKKVLNHLLLNAVKYTPDGGRVSVSGGLHQPIGSTTSTHVEIVVKDSGIGIDPAMQTLIFTKFYQTGEVSLHSSSKTQFKGGGPGLGLSIVKGIVEAHNGRIWVESTGHDEDALPGSEFHIVLPIRWKEAPDFNNSQQSIVNSQQSTNEPIVSR